MTDLDLQEEIIKELKEHLLDHGIMMVRGREFKEINVFPQELPTRKDGDEDEFDEQQWNFIVVALGDEDVVEDRWRVEVHFCIGIEDEGEDRQGYLNLAYIMNEIYLHFTKAGFIGRGYRMEAEAHKRFNYENMDFFYESDLVTYWELPLPVPEGLEEFL